MHVIVVGAGEVGSYVADRLSREGVDVALVEQDAARLRSVADELDVMTVQGSGSHPATLELAGLDRADLVVAVTSSDEVNMVASLVAKQHGVERTVVRVEAPELRGTGADDVREAIGADLVIDPDEEAARDITELLEFPGASEVEYLAGGEVVVLGATLTAASPVVGRTLVQVAQEHDIAGDLLVATVARDDETTIPKGGFGLEVGDQVRVLCRRQGRRQVMDLLGLARRLPRRVMLLGGGRTAELLARPLAKRGADVTLIERDPARARQLAETLHRVTVLEGDFTDAEVLLDAEVGSYDVVIALAGEDHANSLACLFAKTQGATETIAIIHRLELLPLLRQAGIDASLSPRTATANGVLRFVRGGIAGVTTFLEGAAEVLEYEVAPGCTADGGVIAQLGLPDDALIGAVVRDGEAEIAGGSTRLQAGDLVIVVAMSGHSGVSSVFR